MQKEKSFYIKNILKVMLKKIFCLSIFIFSVVLPTVANDIVIFTTNDLHGRLEPFNQNKFGGAARRSELFRTEKNAIILDAGDFAQGTLYFKILPNNLNLDIMGKQGYSAIALGNHDFDKGTQYLKNSALSTDIPLLLSNVQFNDEELNKLIKSYIIKNVNNHKIAIIGVLDSAVKAITSTKSDDYQVFDEIKTLQSIVNEIDKKSDLIIVLSHCGIEKDKKIAQQVKGIDLIIGGHSHTFLKKPLKIKQQNGDIVLISQNGEFGKYVGKWELDIKNDKIKKYKFKQVLIDNKFTEDEEIKSIISNSNAAIECYSNKIAGSSTTKIDARRNVLKKQITSASVLLHTAIKKYYPETDVSFNTSGGYRYGGFLPQVITNKDVMELFPFDSYLVLLKIKGEDLKEILETSSRFLPKPSYSFLQTYGISYTVNLNAKPKVLNSTLDKIIQEGMRISDIYINGIPLDPQKYYTVATDSFMYYGGDGYLELKKYKDVIHTNITFDEILIKYLNENSPVSIELKDVINIMQ